MYVRYEYNRKELEGCVLGAEATREEEGEKKALEGMGSRRWSGGRAIYGEGSEAISLVEEEPRALVHPSLP
jgi:hypothetical protein